MRTATIKNDERLVALTRSDERALKAMKKIYARRRKTILFILDVIKYIGVGIGFFAFEIAIITKDYLYEGPINWYHPLILLFAMALVVFFAWRLKKQFKKISKR